MAKQTSILIEKESIFRVIVRFVRNNAALTISALVVILIVVGVFSYKTAAKKEMNDRASLAFSQAQSIDDYKYIIRNFPNSRIYTAALLNTGNLMANEGKNDEALRYYAEIPLKHKDDYLAPRALCSIGYVYQNKGDYKMALNSFKKMMDDYPGSGWNNEALFNIARTYEFIGELDKAERMYNDILEKSPLTEWRNDIKYRLGKMRQIGTIKKAAK